MRFIQMLLMRARALMRAGVVDHELDDEIREHLDRLADEHVARGMTREAARQAARREFGPVTQIVEQSRDARGMSWLTHAVQDARFGARLMRRAPGFAAAATLTVALGIGATTAIVSAVKPILFEPLPYPDADRLTMIWEMRRDGSHNEGSFGMYRGLSERARSFDAIAVLKPWQPTMTGAAQPERFEGQRVSAGYFHVLGVSPIRGRDFQPSDDRRNGPNVVVLSDALWRRRFAGDPTILGRQITLDDNSYSVIGVMPGGFDNVLAPSAELWAPLQYDLSQGSAWGHHLRTVGRLWPGVPVDRATRELNVIGHAVLNERHPGTYDLDTQFSAIPLHDDLTRSVKPALLAILGAVTLVLVIACVNVTNLLLARGVHRRGELALRAALGAGRTRLIRQLLTESLLLAAMGGVVGIAVALLGVRALVALSPPGLARVGAIGVDGTVFVCGLAITTLIGLAFGLTPALQATRSDPRGDLQHSSRHTGGHRRLRSGLVVAEVALALVLLVSSGLLLRSLDRLFAVAVGFDSSRLLTMQVQVVGHRFDERGVTYRFFDGALEAVRRVPGVTAAALTSQLPLSGDLDEYGAHFEATPTEPARSYSVFRYAVSPGYIETMGIPLRRGRLLGEHDGAGGPRVALISESLAHRRFAGASPVGTRVRIGPTNGPSPYTIVGIVGDVKQASLALSESDAVYINASQSSFADRAMSLVVRTHGDAAALASEVRQAVWSVDKDQPVVRVATLDDLVAASAAERRFALILFEAFALAALVLAAAGIYGVLSGSVAERTREIGVRSVLGASRGDILALVVRQGMVLTGLGVAIGLAAAAAASRAIAAMLFGVSRLDPVTYLGVTAVLAGVSAMACGVPAWRAVRVDPSVALRSE
jgi:putative ABC transport system permease protein